MTSIPIYQVDAFTREPFGGNPAAVCLLDAPRDAAWMQAVAAEMNLSETAFLVPEKDGYRLRWFTPAIEVPLCGHATLASAHTLWETGTVSADRKEIRFYSKSGLLTATREATSGNGAGRIVLDFPRLATEPTELPAEAAEAIPARPVNVARVIGNGKETPILLLELESAEAVRTLRPNLSGLRRPDAVGIMVTARSDSSEHDFVSRCFFPAAGIDEDPATGSAHCSLAPYWQDRLGKDQMVAYQASARGAVIGTQIAGDRVRLLGHAVTVLSGTLIA